MSSNTTDSEVFDVLFNLAVRLLQSGRYIDEYALYKFKSDKDERSLLQMIFMRQVILSSKINLKTLELGKVSVR